MSKDYCEFFYSEFLGNCSPITSNCIRRLFWCGTGIAAIQNAQHILKEAKAALLQLRSPPAVEAKAISLYTLSNAKSNGKLNRLYIFLYTNKI